MAEITRLAPHASKPIVKVHLDGNFWIALPLSIVTAEDLHVGTQLSEQQQDTLEHKRLAAQALTYAIKSLDFHMASRGQLRDRLARKGYPEATIEQTLDRCEQRGAINDQLLAATRAERFRDAGHAAASTRQRLRKQGFVDAEITTALTEAYTDFDEEAVARRILSTRPSIAVNRRRAYAFLARRGFGLQVAGRVAAEFSTADSAGVARAIDPVELERQVRRRYPKAGSDAGDNRRAYAYCLRHGASVADTRALLAQLRRA